MAQGKTTKANFSTTKGLLKKFDSEVVESIREESGFNLSRSLLIQIFFELMIEARDTVDVQKIYDRASLIAEIKRCLSK